MKYRNLLNGSKAEELDHPVTITVYTKCPQKWMLVDMETGEKYQGSKTPAYINLLNKRKNSKSYVIWDKMV